MKSTKIFSFIIIVAILFSGYTNINAQEKPKTNHNHAAVKTDSTKMDSKKKNPIIREGEIDLVKIDKNKDGKVFQDQMCWNVISDKAGRCPLCNMQLKEVSIEQAKKKLVEEGYKVKE